jgi:hypothetical protein
MKQEGDLAFPILKLSRGATGVHFFPAGDTVTLNGRSPTQPRILLIVFV